jgi:acetyl-CoA carboxylase/biotin carboxylase 1
MGVIAVDNRATETVIYADPANEKSVEQTVIEAGSIWFPNSSFKTAQAIKDFNNGERLPLIIFANWRGFSGGQSDMYKEILKFGAYIVDSLVDFKQPVFVYLIGELRGGAWVVLDSQINPTMMEMYAEEDSRGGILEAEGIVEIKFRRPQMLATMERLDEPYRILKKELSNPLTTVEKKEELKILFEKREKELLPLYHQAAVEFADLHDKPGRMQAKGVIKDILRWETSRTFFYWRVLRRTKEEELIRSIQNIDKSIQRKDVELMLEGWFYEDTQTYSETKHALYHSQDAAVSTWLIDSKKEMEIRLERLKFQYTKKAIESLIKSDTKAALDGLISAMKSMDPELKQKFITKLTNS